MRERRASRQQLVERRAQRVAIAAPVERLAPRLFRRHVAVGAHHVSVVGDLRVRHLLRQAEVDQRGAAILPDQDVPGFTSRCSSPRAWTKESPSQTCASASQSACRRSGSFCSTCSSSVSIASSPSRSGTGAPAPRPAARRSPAPRRARRGRRLRARRPPARARAACGRPATASHSRSAMPSTNSIESQGMPSTSPKSSTRTMFGWSRCRSESNSRRSRRVADGSGPGRKSLQRDRLAAAAIDRAVHGAQAAAADLPLDAEWDRTSRARR